MCLFGTSTELHLAFGVLDTGWRLSTTACRNSKRPSPSIQVLLVSLAHVRVLAALPAAASCRRRLRSRVPAFSLCVCRRRDRVCVVALAVRRSRSSSCSLRCSPSASPPGFWMQELVFPSSSLSLRVTCWRTLRLPSMIPEVTSPSSGCCLRD